MIRFVMIGLPVLVVLGMFAIVHHFDAAAERIEQRIYCKNVRNGAWPDFDGNYQELCCPPEEKKLKKDQKNA